MIQRIQTIWLVLVILLASCSAFLPFAHKSLIDVYGKASLEKMNTSTYPALAIAAAAMVVIAAITIFMFKNRKTQKTFCWLGVLASLTCLGLQIWYGYRPSENTALTFGLALPFVCSMLFIKAYADINADDKLVKSVDRLRD